MDTEEEKRYNKKEIIIEKSVERLKRKAIGSVKWQPVAKIYAGCVIV